MTHIIPSDHLSAEAVANWRPMIKKPNPVYMLQMETGFSVETNEGTVTAHSGDYLAHDPISGHFWPVAASYVSQHYE